MRGSLLKENLFIAELLGRSLTSDGSASNVVRILAYIEEMATHNRFLTAPSRCFIRILCNATKASLFILRRGDISRTPHAIQPWPMIRLCDKEYLACFVSEGEDSYGPFDIDKERDYLLRMEYFRRVMGRKGP